VSSTTVDVEAMGAELRDGLQLSLFDSLVKITAEPDESIEQRFERFHRANPHVFRAIVQVARGARSRGLRRWSMNGVFEVLRWVRPVETSGDEWRLNNSYRALYARLVMDRCPDLDGFFEVRRRRAEDDPS